MDQSLLTLQRELTSCRICKDRFAATETSHAPRPVVWFESSARILIAGQAPGKKVHDTGVPFKDRSGDRLRDWLGIDPEVFYDRSRIAIVPMAFCFPGYSKAKADLPPPMICSKTWRTQIVDELSNIQLKILIGGYAQKWHLGETRAPNVTSTVLHWREFVPDVIPLPHPSWRNTAWIKRNGWFETELLPVLRMRVQEALT